jgi:hypothetical protein
LIVLMIDVRRPETCKTYDQKDHYACRMDPDERARLVTATRVLQDEQRVRIHSLFTMTNSVTNPRFRKDR